MRRFIGVVTAMLIFSGAFGQTDPGTSPTQAVIESKLGKDVSKSANQDSTFTLYKAVKDNQSGVPVLHYIVQRNGDKKIVLEGSKTMGVIEWSATYELEEGRSLGSAQGQVSDKRKIDLRPFLQGKP
jgi:hypothetical protein